MGDLRVRVRVVHQTGPDIGLAQANVGYERKGHGLGWRLAVSARGPIEEKKAARLDANPACARELP